MTDGSDEVLHLPATRELTDRIAALDGASRHDLWERIVALTHARTMLELGVYRGAFAEEMLRRCGGIARYYMLDPWQRLADWNKPANVEQSVFDAYYAETLERTAFAGERRVVLRGRTTDVIDEIPDGSLDVAYIDGDHTLRGIAIDLMRTYPKVRPGGVIGGDDYTHSIWQHAESFEPSLVCPFAAYFAEAHGAPLIILPFSQFAIVKPSEPGRQFQVIDTTGSYGPRSLLWQVAKRNENI